MYGLKLGHGMLSFHDRHVVVHSVRSRTLCVCVCFEKKGIIP